MFVPGTRLDDRAPIAVLEPLRAVNAHLLDLLDGFSDDDWQRPTIHGHRDVKDLTAHLLQGSLFRVSALRDGYRPPAGPFAGHDELVRFIQRNNREFMIGMRRVSPAVLRELLARYDAALLDAFAALDPDAPGVGVTWAGQWESPNWFDVAREYSEKWHHQQQLRDATGRPLLDAPFLLVPALETFARGLPQAYRALVRPPGTAISIALGPAPLKLGWTLRREASAWALLAGADLDAGSTIDLPADLAWRIWTKGVSAEAARGGLHVTGDPAHAEPLLACVAVMA